VVRAQWSQGYIARSGFKKINSAEKHYDGSRPLAEGTSDLDERAEIEVYAATQ
jgi:hypothetical protein